MACGKRLVSVRFNLLVCIHGAARNNFSSVVCLSSGMTSNIVFRFRLTNVSNVVNPSSNINISAIIVTGLSCGLPTTASACL